MWLSSDLFAQVNITFTNNDLGFCAGCSWIDPGIKSGVSPVGSGWGNHGYYGGWWDITVQSKKNCFNRDSTSSNFGEVSLCCLGVSQQDANGNFIPWRLIYYYKDTGGVITKDSIGVTIYPNPVVSAGPDKSVCQNAPSFQIYPYPNTGFKSGWMAPPSPIPNGSNSPLSYNSTSRTNVFNPLYATQDSTYTMVYVDSVQYPKARCVNTDTAVIYIRPIPQVDAGRLADLCEDAGLIDLPAKSGARVFPSQMTGVAKWTGPGVDSTIFFFNPKGAGVSYVFPNILKFCFTNDTGCTNCDTTTIMVHNLPQVSLVDVPDMCETYGMFILKGNHPQGANSKFNLNAVMCNDTLFSWPDSLAGFPTHYGGNYVTYTFIDSFGCKNTVADSFFIYHQPKVKIIGQNPYYPGKPFSLKRSLSYSIASKWTRVEDGMFTFANPLIQDSVSTDSIVGYLPGAIETANRKFTVVLTSTDITLCATGADTLTVGVWALSTNSPSKSHMNIYPNPVERILHLSFSETDVYTIQLMDVLGRVCYEQKARGNAVELDLEALHLYKGLHSVVAVAGDRIYSAKFIHR